MPDFRERYKRLGFGRENVLAGRAIRSQRQNEERRERRSQLFSVHRDQNQCSDNLEEASKEDTASSSKQRDDTGKTNDEESSKQRAITKWRKEKYRRKLVDKKESKPPFKVGIVHHRLYSPPLSKKNPNPSPPARLCKLRENRSVPVPVKMVTKATQNRIAVKALESKQKSETKKLKNSQEIPKVPLAPKDHEFKAPEGVNAIPLFGRRALEAAQQSFLTACTLTVANCSVASFISEEESNLNPNSTSTPLPAPAVCLSQFMVCNSNKDLARKELEEALNNLSENNIFQSNFSKNSFGEPSQNGTPTKLPSHEEETKTLTPKNTTEPSQPESLSPFMVCSCDKNNVCEELQKSLVSPEKDFLQADTSKNLFHEFVHSPRNEAHASPKTLSDEEATNTLVEETGPPPAQLFDRLSPFMASSNDEEEKTIPEENTTQYFKYLLNKETERLNGLCDSWDLVKKATSTPEDIQYLIQSAIGQTQLLIGKKFKCFGGLVQECENGEGEEMSVTCKDLLGFWELMYIEIEDCNGRFSKLEELKANGWIDKAAEQLKQKPAFKKAAVVKKKVPVARSNSLKAHIAAARKKMQNDRETGTMKSAPEIVIQDVDVNLAVPASGDHAEVNGKALNEKEMRYNEEILSSSELGLPKIQIDDVNVQREGEKSKILSLNASPSQPSTPTNKLVLKKMHPSSSKSSLIALKMSNVDTRGIAFERVSPRKSISPAKKDTPGVKSSKLKGKFLEFSPRKDDDTFI